MLYIPLVLILASWLVCQWARSRYDGMLKENLRATAPGGATGEQVALEFLRDEGVTDVQVVVHDATVSDYFDPARRRLFLRKTVAKGDSIAAWSIALHEASHALQTGEELEALRWRQSCIRMTRYLPVAVFLAALALMVFVKLPFRTVFMLVAGSLALLTLLNAGTLGVERQANTRLRNWLEKRFSRQPALLERLESTISPVATRELGDLFQSPRYFFFSALPGSGKGRP